MSDDLIACGIEMWCEELTKLVDSCRTIHIRDLDNPARGAVYCGESNARGSWTKTSAIDVVQNAGRGARQVCRVCLEKIGASVRDLSHITARRGTITLAQERYITALVRESKQPFDWPSPDAISTMSRRDAAALIDKLVSAKANGWKR
jgi:hypothetical protein